MNNNIPENIVIKLFDQVADSSEKNIEATEKLTTVIGNLNDTLKDIERDIVAQKEEIGKIKKVAYTIKNRVVIMIAVVFITFTLLVGSYFFVSNGIEKTVDIKLQHAIEEVLKK